MRLRLRTRFLAAWLFAVAACAHDDGSPWGVLDVELQSAFDFPASRMTQAGRLKTAQSYGIEELQLGLQFESITVRMSTDDVDLSFDPAQPPPDYSLCHNGHCHHADGRLVPYEEIERELTQNSGGMVLSIPVDPVTVGVAPSGVPSWVPVEIGKCPNRCNLSRGRMAQLEVAVTRITVSGIVFDEKLGSFRLPSSGVPLSVQLDVSAVVTGPLQGTIGKRRRVGYRLSSVLRLTEKLFDDIDWEIYFKAISGTEAQFDAANGALAVSLAERVSNDSTLVTDSKRFDL